MKKKRKRHAPEFKARVALEALKGERTIQNIAAEYEIHPVQVSEWKKVMAANAAMVFVPKVAKTEADEFETERQHLHAKIGQQTVELDWLAKKDNSRISMRRQCELLGVDRSTVDYVPVPEDTEDLLIKRLLDEIYLKDPCLGSRLLVTGLDRD